jgi:hypothetical protein
MFTRQEVCTLADIPVERIKSWIRRNELPTAYTRDQAKQAGWNRFSAVEVFKIAIQESLFRQIGEFSGVAADTASWVVAMNGDAVQKIISSGTPKDKDRWIGYAGALRDGSTKEKSVYSNVSGSLDDILTALQPAGGRYVRLLLVNADDVLRQVQARAKKHLKIDFVASALIEMADSARD